MTKTELLEHTKKQLAGVEKKMATFRYKRDKEPYQKQIDGLHKKIEKLEQLLSVVTLEGEQVIQ